MICTTCGRENQPHLTFCQECGQRLGPRIAPPTPPIGLGGDDAPKGLTPFAAMPAAVPAAAHAGAGSHSPTAGSAGPAPPTTTPVRCKVCDTPNAAGLRYCTSCGSTLEAGRAAAAPSPAFVAPAAAPSPAFAAPPAVAMPVHSPGSAATAPLAAHPPAALRGNGVGASHGAPETSPIAPGRVVDLGRGEPTTPDAPVRSCNRCRGAVDPGAQFCKFCGAPLAEAPEPARPAPPAQAPPAPVAAPVPAPVVAPELAPLLPHERLELPRGNGTAPTAPESLTAEAKSAVGAEFARPAVPFVAVAPAPPPTGASPVSTPAAVALAAVAAASPSPARPATSTGRAVTRGRLVVIAKSGADGPSYPIGDTLDIGRVEGNVIVSEDPYLSPRHVRIAWTSGKLVLRDLASTNGVYLRLAPGQDMNALRRNPGGANASPARPPVADDVDSSGEVAVPLRDQDLILVGQQVLRFEVESNADSGFGPAVEHGTLLFGSPAAPRYARLGQRTVEGVARDVYYVRKLETVLGRESGDVVFTEDPFLSRRHAAIRVLGRDGAPLASGAKPASGDAVRFALVDLGSSNGTFLRIRNDVDLAPGDHFRVGQQLFRVDFDNRDDGRRDDGRSRTVDDGGRAG